MKLSKHADHSEKMVGLRGEDIHRWIDGLFDVEGFDQLLRGGRSPDFDPYDHRKFRHCAEAIPDAISEFADIYTPEQVRAVFECHVRDDYNGYLPSREDFENGTFKEKYHDNDEQATSERILSPLELTEYFKGKTYAPARKRSGKDRSFLLRIALPTAIAILLFVGSVFAFVVPVFRESMLESKRQMIRELTTAAASMVAYCAKQQREGKLSASQAKKLAASKIGAMRYGSDEKDYFWITDMHPTMVMHPYRPDLVGADLTRYSDTKGEKGKRLFVEFVRIVRNSGSGYLEYLWQWKDDSSRMAPKLSYVRGIPAWGWILGTGVYIDDVQREIDSLTRNLLLIFALISVLLAGILASVVWQSRRLEAHRLRAETGLLEAKERYRALVEASKEGYVLDVDGECIYSNRTLQRLIGQSEAALAGSKVVDLLMPEVLVNDRARGVLKKLSERESVTGSFEAQLATKSNEP
ncbi:MAG: cache domain-containing protein, partial [Deltaproteobacteria bacterium]|nr:cache domain-containing protein [Deltaproteobacteria bacterium]